MALTLIVQSGWRDQVETTWKAFPRIVPVLKGNGYGFGRPYLAALSADLGADEIAVGSVYELVGLHDGYVGATVPKDPHAPVPSVGAGLEKIPEVIVLTPCQPHDHSELQRWPDAIVTVGSHRDLTVVTAPGDSGARDRAAKETVTGSSFDASSRRVVIVKIESSMRRYGVPADEALGLARAAQQAGCEVRGFALHLPLGQSPADGLVEARAALAVVPDDSVFYLSHVAPEVCAELQAARLSVRIRPRIGTALWLGDKRCLGLAADVAAVRPVRIGDRVGYRQQPVPGDGSVVMVAAGTAQGVQVLPDGRSPFHFARQRLALCEPPHMHTSMCFVPASDVQPVAGESVDVQQPITRVQPDHIRWL